MNMKPGETRNREYQLRPESQLAPCHLSPSPSSPEAAPIPQPSLVLRTVLTGSNSLNVASLIRRLFIRHRDGLWGGGSTAVEARSPSGNDIGWPRTSGHASASGGDGGGTKAPTVGRQWANRCWARRGRARSCPPFLHPQGSKDVRGSKCVPTKGAGKHSRSVAWAYITGMGSEREKLCNSIRISIGYA